MSEFLKIEDGKAYFITFTVINWLDIFLKEGYTNILIDSIKYCQQNKGLEVYAYCIMPSHVHMIAAAKDGSLGSILRDMKKHTSKQIVKAIEENNSDSKRELFLNQFYTAAKNSNRHKKHSFWQEANYPVELYSDKFIIQKETYIHMNPVKAGIVSKHEYYRLSSASDESPIKILPWK